MKSSRKKKKLAFHVLLISTFQLTVRNFAAAVNTLEALQFCSMRQDAMDHYSMQQMFNPEQCANHVVYATNSLKTLKCSKKKPQNLPGPTESTGDEKHTLHDVVSKNCQGDIDRKSVV